MPGVTIRKSPNYWSGHSGQRVKACVLHVTGGTKGKEYPNAVSWLSSPTSGVSAHFVVSQAGDITQLVSIYDSAWANGLSWSQSRGSWIDPEGNAVTPAWAGLVIPVNPNWLTVSIETARQSSDPMSQQMFDAVIRILQWIKAEFGWTYTAHGNLVGHNELSPVSRPYCPGPNVSLTKLADAANTTATTVQKFVVVSPDNLNVRTGPGTEYPIVTSLPPGKAIWIDVQKPNGWYHLAKAPEHNQDDIGFVAGWYLKAVS
jgi:N-acetyl-anhydromuramyl-L-alanine amidase AmpD